MNAQEDVRRGQGSVYTIIESRRCTVAQQLACFKVASLPAWAQDGQMRRRARSAYAAGRNTGTSGKCLMRGFGPTVMSEMAHAIELAKQRRNERCHFRNTSTDVDRRRKQTSATALGMVSKCPGKPTKFW